MSTEPEKPKSAFAKAANDIKVGVKEFGSMEPVGKFLTIGNGLCSLGAAGMALYDKGGNLNVFLTGYCALIAAFFLRNHGEKCQENNKPPEPPQL